MSDPGNNSENSEHNVDNPTIDPSIKPKNRRERFFFPHR